MEIQKKFFKDYENVCLFFRCNFFLNIMEQSYLFFVDIFKYDLIKENRDIFDFCYINEDSVYDIIEDNEGYLKSFDLRRNSSF